MRADRVPFSHRALQAWARSAIHVVYRHTEVTGFLNVPADRPAILAANHTNALADIAVIVAKTEKFPRFLAAASWWASPAARALFRLGGVVPIHRTRDRTDTRQNRASFEACHAALALGAHVAIFPEGEMHSEPTLMPLKTGAARIALGAANDAGVHGIVIVPVGLVYEDRGRFRSDVEVRFGDPIEIDAWAEQARTDPRQTARDITDLLAERLAQITVSCADTNPGPVNQDIDLATSATTGHPDDSKTRRGERQPPATNHLRLELALLAVPAALGLVANAPIVLGAWLASTQATRESWKATTKGVAGTFLCPMVWTIEYTLLARHTGRRRAFALTCAGATSGLATLAWYDRCRARPRE